MILQNDHKLIKNLIRLINHDLYVQLYLDLEDAAQDLEYLEGEEREKLEGQIADRAELELNIMAYLYDRYEEITRDGDWRL